MLKPAKGTLLSGAELVQTAPHGYIYEYGTVVRENKAGANRGRMTASPTFFPIAASYRRTAISGRHVPAVSTRREHGHGLGRRGGSVMAIERGIYGQIGWDPAGGTAIVPIVSLKAWTGEFTTEYEDVTCFGDTNKVYLPGMPDAKGTVSGHFNNADLALFRAALSPTPGTLKLTPNLNSPAIFFQGKAYMSASIDCSLESPKVEGTWQAAGPWTVPGRSWRPAPTADRQRHVYPGGRHAAVALAEHDRR